MVIVALSGSSRLPLGTALHHAAGLSLHLTGDTADSVAQDSVQAALPALRGAADSTVAIPDSIMLPTENPNTSEDDSIALAIRLHNKAVDDSLRLDSINRRKKNGIDAPVVYSGNDSLVYIASSNTAHIFGDAKVDYENMKLESERIYMSLDSSIVHAEGVTDTAGVTTGTPIFNMGKDKYESDRMSFNFKTKKGLINSVYTQQ